MTEQPWTRLEIRTKLIEALGLPPEVSDGLTLEQIITLVGSVNQSLRQQVQHLQDKVRDQEVDLGYPENMHNVATEE